MITGTATPLSSVGVNCHCRTASSAGPSSSGTPRRMRASTTSPAGPIVASRMMTPCTPASRRGSRILGLDVASLHRRLDVAANPDRRLSIEEICRRRWRRRGGRLTWPRGKGHLTLRCSFPKFHRTKAGSFCLRQYRLPRRLFSDHAGFHTQQDAAKSECLREVRTNGKRALVGSKPGVHVPLPLGRRKRKVFGDFLQVEDGEYLLRVGARRIGGGGIVQRGNGALELSAARVELGNSQGNALLPGQRQLQRLDRSISFVGCTAVYLQSGQLEVEIGIRRVGLDGGLQLTLAGRFRASLPGPAIARRILLLGR